MEAPVGEGFSLASAHPTLLPSSYEGILPTSLKAVVLMWLRIKGSTRGRLQLAQQLGRIREEYAPWKCNSRHSPGHKKESHIGEAMNTGLLATIVVFALAVIFGLVLWADARKTAETGKGTGVTARPTTSPSRAEAKTQPDSWQKSAERFRRSDD